MAKKPAKKKVVAKKKAPPKKVAAKSAKKVAPKKKAAGPKKVIATPEGLGTVTANLVLKDCTKAIAFYQEAFGAKVLTNMPLPDGKGVWHAALQIGNSQIFVNDPDPANPYTPPAGQMWVYGEDVDARFERAVKAGATVSMPLWDAFWGDRFGMVRDPFGQIWVIVQHMKDITPAEAQVAGEAFAKSQGDSGPPSH